MSAPVLLPKITPPRLRPGVVSRRRLLDAIHQDIDRKLFMVVAPAGYGKTALLADFAADAAFPVCWYTLDSEARDLRVFLSHVVAALRVRFPTFGAQTTTLLEHAQDVQRELPTLIATLVNEIHADVGELFALVLDDFQTVDESRIISQAMDELLRYLPDNCRLLLASRTIPRITFSTLTARLQVAGLGVGELRFTGDEIQTLLKERHRVLLMPDQAEKLAHESEGWITGILLGTHSLWRGLLDTLIRAKSPSGGLVYDFLAIEVLDQQPEDLRDFLFLSSVGPRTGPTQLEALVGSGPWEALFDRAMTEGLFLDRLEGEEPWYRYHHMFREFLQQRFADRDRPRYEALHRRASGLAADRGELGAAMEHLHLAGAEAEAAELLEQRADGLVAGGTWRLLADLVAALPETIQHAHPRLRLLRGQSGLWLSEPEMAETVGDALVADSSGSERARALLLRGNARRLLGRLAEAEQDLADAASLSAADSTLLADAELWWGICQGVQGNLEGSAQHLGRALPLYESSGDERNLALARFNLGVTCARRGALQDAATHYRVALGAWTRLGDAFLTADTLHALGNLQFVRGDYGEAFQLLERALTRSRQLGYLSLQADVLDSLSSLQRARSDLSAALSSSEEALALARRLGEASTLSTLLDGLATVWRLSGDLDKAEQFARQAQHLAEEHESRYDQALAHLTLGAIALGREQLRPALGEFRAANTLLGRLSARRDLARARLRLAQVRWELGEHNQAKREARALALALRECGQYGLVAPEAAERPAVLRAVLAEGGPLELARVLELCTPSVSPALAGTSIRGVDRPQWPQLRAYAFGPPRVECDGRLIPGAEWESGKAVELFFLLIANAPEATSESIADALWPDATTASGKSNLYTTVYRLRRAIHQEALARRPGVYALNPAMPLWEDATEFERLLAHAERGPQEEKAATLRSAVELYRGHYLDGIYSEWCQSRRHALEVSAMLALSTLATIEMASGQYPEALSRATRLLALDPLHDDAHRWTIQLLGLLGDRAGAVRHYRLYTELVQDKLGERPSAEVEQAYRALAGDSPAFA